MKKNFMIVFLVIALALSVFGNVGAAKTVPDNSPRLAILSAFDSELQLLLDQTTSKRTYVLNGRTFTTGRLRGVKVVMALSGVSMVNAAANTQLLFDNFNVTGLVFSGIAGGVNPSLHIGDVVVPAQWGQYQEMTFAREVNGEFNLPPWMQPEFPNYGMMFPSSTSVTHKGGQPDVEERKFWFAVDAELLSYAEGIPDSVLAQCTADLVCLDEQPIIKVGGNGVAGQTFVDNASFREYAWNTFQADSLDMETSAVAAVAYMNQVPFLAFRSLSDLAGGGDGENEIGIFFQIAANNSANTLLAWVDNYKVGEGIK
jgi:adenosylhomocysteine nucleosidase